MNPAMMDQIANEYRTLMDINSSLSSLDVTIAFLTSVGKKEDTTTLLKEFMLRLRLKPRLHSDQVTSQSLNKNFLRKIDK